MSMNFTGQHGSDFGVDYGVKKYSGKTYKGFIPNNLPGHIICGFGSNPEGRHGAGTALICMNHHGAKHGLGSGLQGNSWAIITTDLTNRRRPNVGKSFIISEIKKMYDWFSLPVNAAFECWVMYTTLDNRPNLSGFTNQELADMFSVHPIPANVVFEEGFATLLNPIK